MIRELYKYFKLELLKLKWRLRNRHNSTNLNSICNINNVQVGIKTYGDLNIEFYDKNGSVIIGNYCSIAKKCIFLCGGEHDYKRISTWPFQTKIYQRNKLPIHTKSKDNQSKIVVEDDVWLGYDCLILSGVTIGKGSVVGARSIVSKDIPPYSIFAGNRIIKQRFSNETINKLKEIDFSSITHTFGDKYNKYVITHVDDSNVDEIINAFTDKNAN